jgi:hypothetical protein
MRVKHQFLPPSQMRRVALLALGIALAPCLMAPVWAENFNLDSVDFANSDAGMRIVLHTGSIVPVQKVLISENKVILDVDQVNSGETVRTNFAGATNVSHVIMQPLNDHKIRMIIRGEGLSAPTVAFYGAGSSSDGGGLSAEESSKLSMETSAALHRQQESGMQAAVNTDKLVKAPLGERPAVDHPPLQDEPIAYGGFVESKPSQSDHRNGKLDLKPTETGPLALHASEVPTSASNDFLAQMTTGKWDKYIPYGLLALVMLGAGAFVRHKLTQLNPVENGFEDLLEEQQQQQGKRASFREMADAYRSKHDEKRTEPSGANRKANSDSMIGLRGLNQQDLAEQDESPLPVQRPILDLDEPPKANTLEQILAAMQAANQPKKPMGVPAPKKQAVNQYMQAQAPQGKPKTRQAADEAMLQEMKRAQMAQQELQQQVRQQHAAQAAAQANNPGYTPVNRAAAAKKAVKTPNFQTMPSGNAVNAKNPPTPNRTANANPAPTQRGYVPGTPKGSPVTKASPQQGPLPGNPEVLNFLRNVAELMEKDGKADIAKSIHKNLGTKNIGIPQ